MEKGQKDPLISAAFTNGLALGTIGTAFVALLAYELGRYQDIPDGETQAGFVSLKDATLASRDFDGDGRLETILRIKETPFEVREQYDAEGNLVLHRRVFGDNQTENR
ncbi:hypothetical protein HYS49_03850 [Candidatus Woesearchaeota archaeon]|nr:hypothetical protein [Candidatus Woesearchaeota archaeon]